ncbi:MAG: TonB-dependent receptor [Bradyrhizobium sp.]|nr:TonB-dependent receptor [Bradyrhizobium sp.]
MTAATLALAADFPAWAQTSTPNPATSTDIPPGEIVVTATRQSESLSKVPISVSAFSQAKLDAQGIRNINDLSRITPGLYLAPYGSNDVSGTSRSISIRGISSDVGAPTTGIYIDDTPIQTRSLGYSSSAVFPQIFDLDRIEVLKGPQGTLFGAGAEGGAVRFITPQPSLARYSVYARSELAETEGGDPSYEAGAAVGGPLVQDTLGFRLSGWFRDDGGYIDRVDHTSLIPAERNVNSQQSRVLRGSLKWEPAPGLTATLAVFNQHQRLDGANSFYANLSDPENGVFRSGNPLPQRIRDTFTLPSLTLEYDAGPVKFISTTSYFQRRTEREVDYSVFVGSLLFGAPFAYQPGQYSVAYLDDGQKQINQEVRIQSNTGARLHWTVGAFYSNSRQKTNQNNYDPFVNTVLAGFGVPPLQLYQGIGLFHTDAKSNDKQISGFGQIDYEIVEGLKLTAGVRVAKADLQAQRYSAGPIAGPDLSFNARQSETPVTPKFGASYQVNQNALLYVSASKGFRVGGVNGPQNSFCGPSLAAIGLTGGPNTYNSDSVWSYEGGAKSVLFNGKLRVDASVFNINWRNIQREVLLAACGGAFITNLGAAQSTGFDASLDWRLSRQLTLSASLGYANARLTQNAFGSTPPGGTPTAYGYKGDKIGGPPWNWTVSGEYDFKLPFYRKGYARFDYQHSAPGVPIDYKVAGADPTIPSAQATNEISLRAGVRMGGADLSLFVNNLLDEAPILTTSRFTTTLSQPYFQSTLRPRTAGMTLTYRY